MKRSEINRLQREAVEFFREQMFHLPPWAYWGKREWQRNRSRAAAIIENRLGWDLTDFGLSDFYQTGLLLFTLRNGRPGSAGKKYAEKIMIVRDAQMTPWHFHWQKMEDIINRGGGELVIELCRSRADDTLDDANDVTIEVDGILRTIPPCGEIRLQPGESVTLPPRMYHQFFAAPGKGAVLAGEVSRVNDDERDNRFLDAIGRFPSIVEDEPPLYYLCNEYPAFPA